MCRDEHFLLGPKPLRARFEKVGTSVRRLPAVSPQLKFLSTFRLAPGWALSQHANTTVRHSLNARPALSRPSHFARFDRQAKSKISSVASLLSAKLSFRYHDLLAASALRVPSRFSWTMSSGILKILTSGSRRSESGSAGRRSDSPHLCSRRVSFPAHCG